MATEHIVSSYNDELVALAQTIAEMGGQVEVAIENGTKSLLKLDRELADVTIIADQRIDDMQRKIDDMAVSMIARRQPMASDLRAIITAIHVASDLERVGDMAKQLARRSLKLEGMSLQPTFYNGVKNMTALVLRQVKDALDAYANRDSAAAQWRCATATTRSMPCTPRCSGNS
jgi:phosphate transport system protein